MKILQLSFGQILFRLNRYVFFKTWNTPIFFCANSIQIEQGRWSNRWMHAFLFANTNEIHICKIININDVEGKSFAWNSRHKAMDIFQRLNPFIHFEVVFLTLRVFLNALWLFCKESLPRYDLAQKQIKHQQIQLFNFSLEY